MGKGLGRVNFARQAGMPPKRPWLHFRRWGRVGRRTGGQVDQRNRESRGRGVEGGKKKGVSGAGRGQVGRMDGQEGTGGAEVVRPGLGFCLGAKAERQGTLQQAGFRPGHLSSEGVSLTHVGPPVTQLEPCGQASQQLRSCGAAPGPAPRSCPVPSSVEQCEAARRPSTLTTSPATRLCVVLWKCPWLSQ